MTMTMLPKRLFCKHTAAAFLAAIALSAGSAIAAEPLAKPGGDTISMRTLHGYTVSDVKLHMSEEEAKAALEAKGLMYESDTDQTARLRGKTNDYAVYRGLDSQVQLKFYTDEKKVRRVWALEYAQPITPGQSIVDWQKRIMDRYGDAPTRAVQLSHTIELYYSARKIPEGRVSSTLCTKMVKDREQCYALDALEGEFDSHYNDDVKALSVTIQQKTMWILLADYTPVEEAKKRADADAKRAVEDAEVNF